ncbi:hypothetical protein BGW80DRAFT_1462257 [Lactifluus volemus]|nr:hypothetical protein BGW80DRAFT_1462257 [Lactifluus volemus]
MYIAKPPAVMTGLVMATTTAMARRQHPYPHGRDSKSNNVTTITLTHPNHKHRNNSITATSVMAITSESQPHDHDRYIHTTSIVTAVAITPTTFAESTNHHVYDGHDHIAITNTTMLTVFAAPTIMTPTTTLRCFPMLRQLEQRSFSPFPAVATDIAATSLNRGVALFRLSSVFGRTD